MKYIVRKTGPRWQGLRMLELEEFPSSLANASALMDGMIRICSASRLHCELVSMKKKGSDKLYIVLILRWSGVSSGELEKRMEMESDILQKQLDSFQIQTSWVENTDKGKRLILPLLRRYTEKEGAEDRLSQAFFPTEPVRERDSLYLPGSWSQNSATGTAYNLNWNEIGSILSGYEEHLFSLQLIPTVLFPVETEEIRRNVRWMNGQEKLKTKAVDTRFGDLLRMKDQKLYLVNLWISGNAEAAREIRLYFREKGLSSVMLPRYLLSDTGYPMTGDWKLTNYLNRVGHRTGFTEDRLHPAIQRLTRLVSEPELRSCFALPGSWNGINGLSTHGTGNRPVSVPDQMRDKDQGVFIGKQEKTDRDVFLPIGDLTRHGCIVGKPGSGKTTFSLGFLYHLQKRDHPIPFLAIEPAKKEYRTLMECIPELKVYTPGATGVSPMQMNLFLPPAGVTLEEYLPCVDQIFDMSFSMTSLLKDIFTKVIRRCYNLYGWRNESSRDSEGAQPFGLHEFIREFRRYIRENVYDPESRNNVENSGVLRLQKLLEANPVMFDTIQAPDYSGMLTEPTVIELDAISDPTQKSLVMAIIIVNLMALIRKRVDFSGELQNVILIDEAHVLLNPEAQVRDADAADPGRAALKMIQNMTLILRAYGTALFFGDQSPAKLTKEILGNVNAKLMFRLDDPDDRSILGRTALMNQGMLDEMVLLKPGQGFLGCNRTNEPILLQTTNAEKELKLKKNLPDEMVSDRMRTELPAPFAQCSRCTLCKGFCNSRIRSDAGFLAQSVIMQSRRLKEILPADPEKAKKTQAKLPEYLKTEFSAEAEKIAGEKGVKWTEQLAACAEIQMIRELLINGSCLLSEKELLGEEPVSIPDSGDEPGATPFSKLFR